MKTYRIVLLTAVLTIAGCSSTPLVPTEDRYKLPPKQTQTKEVPTLERATVVPLPADTASQSPAVIEPIKTTPNTVIVPASPSTIATNQQSPAVITLLDEASRYTRQGDLRAAQTRLQRAQRIAPSDPEVYFALAKTHIQLEDYALAEQVALKGVSIVQGQDNELHRFWTLIAQIRSAAGNIIGAKHAQQKADNY